MSGLSAQDGSHAHERNRGVAVTGEMKETVSRGWLRIVMIAPVQYASSARVAILGAVNVFLVKNSSTA